MINFRLFLFRYIVIAILNGMLFVFLISTSLLAQFAGANNMNPMDHGPFVSTTITKDPGISSEILVYKGIAVKLDSNPDAAMVFDTDLLRVATAWTGGFLHWYPARDGLQERSEEHTSELQSRGHLVCRLLLEKKKKIKRQK